MSTPCGGYNCWGDDMAKLKMNYAVDFFTGQLEKFGHISNRDKLTCVKNIKNLFGETLANYQTPFIMIDISKKQLIDKNISNSKLLVHERLQNYGIDVLRKTLAEIVQKPQLANKKYAGSTVNAGAYADALIKSTYPRVLSGQTLPKSKFQIVANTDQPTFIHPSLGQITNGIVETTGESISGASTFIYYYTSKGKIKAMHLYYLLSYSQL
jgi:hypothetical protein